ncbi:leucine-rich_repeat domain-containing protein [Hexamita inflata]|uniref:Partial n=1 Tax=Hexamita inflata TaxID=28002 RepID=A0AA86TGM9_9EUKA|nr:leucine-rich repeat domain-containing protein [Hexamita inflata]
MIKQWIKQIQKIKQYRKAVQHGCYRKQYIFIGNDENLRDISFFRILDKTSLCLQQCTGIYTEILFFAFFQQLHSDYNIFLLYINYNLINNFTLAKNKISVQLNTVPKSLNGLSIKNSGLQNIDDLSNLNGLQRLDFTCNNIQRVDVLVKAINLKSLSLNENININLVQVGKLIQLNELRLDNIGFSDINFLVDLPNLTILSMDQNKINDISYISHLKQLQELSLSKNQIFDLSSLKQLVQLQQLQLSENNISDLSPLRWLVQLQTLALNNNNIVDIDVLKYLTALNRLELDNNQIHNIWPLAGLSSWNILLLKNNRISELCPIYNENEIFKILDLSNNFITDLQPLPEDHYSQLFLENNYIMNIKPLYKTITLLLNLDNNYIIELNDLEVLKQVQQHFQFNITFSAIEQKQPSPKFLLLIRKRQIIQETFKRIKTNESHQSKNEPKMRELKLKMQTKVLLAQKQMVNFSENLKKYFREEQVSQ